jgi:hypothetical protein
MNASLNICRLSVVSVGLVVPGTWAVTTKAPAKRHPSAPAIVQRQHQRASRC